MSDQDTQDTQVNDDQSNVLKELRAERDRYKRELEELPQKIKAQVQREHSVKQVFEDLGYPKFADIALEKLEGDINQETASEFLQQFGIEPGQPKQRTNEQKQSLGNVASLGDQLAAKASAPLRSLEEKLQAIDGKNYKEAIQAAARAFQEEGIPVDLTSTRF